MERIDKGGCSGNLRASEVFEEEKGEGVLKVRRFTREWFRWKSVIQVGRGISIRSIRLRRCYCGTMERFVKYDCEEPWLLFGRFFADDETSGEVLICRVCQKGRCSRIREGLRVIGVRNGFGKESWLNKASRNLLVVTFGPAFKCGNVGKVLRWC